MLAMNEGVRKYDSRSVWFECFFGNWYYIIIILYFMIILFIIWEWIEIKKTRTNFWFFFSWWIVMFSRHTSGCSWHLKQSYNRYMDGLWRKLPTNRETSRAKCCPCSSSEIISIESMFLDHKHFFWILESSSNQRSKVVQLLFFFLSLQERKSTNVQEQSYTFSTTAAPGIQPAEVILLEKSNG